jgi:hypothetical protein
MGLFGGLLQGLGGILGAAIGAHDNSKAIGKATQAQIDASNKAIAEQQREYDTTRSDFMPFMEFGTGSLGQLGDLLGLNGNHKAQASIASLKASPLFSSLFNTGKEAVLQDASATGGVRGGDTQGALYELGSNTLAQVIQQQVQNLFGGAGVGEGSTGTVANIGAHTADNISSADTSIGNSLYNKIIGKQQVWNNLGDQIQKIFANIATSGGF